MNITQSNSFELTEDDKDKMFSMYRLSYEMGGQELWFTPFYISNVEICYKFIK